MLSSRRVNRHQHRLAHSMFTQISSRSERSLSKEKEEIRGSRHFGSRNAASLSQPPRGYVPGFPLGSRWIRRSRSSDRQAKPRGRWRAALTRHPLCHTTEVSAGMYRTRGHKPVPNKATTKPEEMTPGQPGEVRAARNCSRSTAMNEASDKTKPGLTTFPGRRRVEGNDFFNVATSRGDCKPQISAWAGLHPRPRVMPWWAPVPGGTGGPAGGSWVSTGRGPRSSTP